MPILILAAYLLVVMMGLWLAGLNIRHLRKEGGTVPPEFEGVVDPAVLRKITAYTVDRARLDLVETSFDTLLVLVFLFGGLAAAYDRLVGSITGSFLAGGILFVLVLVVAETIIGIPFSLYRHFRLENRYGFNTMTVRLWTTDLVKSLAIAAVLTTVAVSVALRLVQWSPAWWWVWVWAFFLVLSLFVMYIAPFVIEPLFFTFGPLRVEGLEDRIRALLQRAGLSVSRVFQVDASRRSRHSNAYFTGIGRVKRIVLFDTLLNQMTEDEVLAILAHEAGHWKKHHVLKKIILTEVIGLAAFYLAFRLLAWEGLPGLIGLEEASFYLRVVVLGFLASIMLFPFTPLFSALSRRDEREADRFAVELSGNAGAMASALVKLSKENLSNLHPHPLYAKFYYSHPPVVERVRELKAATGGGER
jgi:STE24 endopeptidase